MIGPLGNSEFSFLESPCMFPSSLSQETLNWDSRETKGAFHYVKLTGQRSVGKYLRKIKRQFPIKSGQPIEMGVVILNSFAEFPN